MSRRHPRPRPRIRRSTGRALHRPPPARAVGALRHRERRSRDLWSRGLRRPGQSSRRMSTRCRWPPTMARRRPPREPRRPRQRSCRPAGQRRVRRCPARRLQRKCRGRALHRPLHRHRRPSLPVRIPARWSPRRRRRRPRRCGSRFLTRSLQPPRRHPRRHRSRCRQPRRCPTRQRRRRIRRQRHWTRSRPSRIAPNTGPPTTTATPVPDPSRRAHLGLPSRRRRGRCSTACARRSGARAGGNRDRRLHECRCSAGRP